MTRNLGKLVRVSFPLGRTIHEMTRKGRKNVSCGFVDRFPCHEDLKNTAPPKIRLLFADQHASN